MASGFRGDAAAWGDSGVDAVTIHRGPTAGTPANEVPRDWWPDLIQWRRYTTHQQIPKDCRALVFYVKDAEATGDWLGYGSRDAYLRDGLGIPPETVKWALDGLKLLPDPSRPVPLAEAVELGRHGGDRSGKQGTDGTLTSRGATPAYLAARLRRDAPDIAARISDFPSVRAAAKEAGIVRKQAQVTLGKPETVARRLIQQGDDYARAVIQAVEEQLRDRG
jgi:hypothetical protein